MKSQKLIIFQEVINLDNAFVLINSFWNVVKKSLVCIFATVVQSNILRKKSLLFEFVY